jgi:pimeloyl-ACP methyl ester carboxylesterase
MANDIVEHMERFALAYGKEIDVDGIRWRYYRLGSGPVLLWLTGGLRRAAYGFGFMQELAARHTIIAPDYPPLKTARSLVAGLDAILSAEGVERLALGGQSYGGLMAQVYLSARPDKVERLILSSTGPAGYGRLAAFADRLLAFLAGVLPERWVKGLLGRGLSKAISAPQAERAAWLEAVRDTLEHDLTRADMVSHFAVAGDAFGGKMVRPEILRAWPARVVVLSAENDPTQGKGDLAGYEALFGRPVELVSLGAMGHTAALFDPVHYAALLEQALG